MPWRKAAELTHLEPSMHVPVMDVPIAPSHGPLGDCHIEQPKVVQVGQFEDHAEGEEVRPSLSAPVKGRVEAKERRLDMGDNGHDRVGGKGELPLVRALGEIILRAQEMQADRLFEQGKRVEETLNQQQCILNKQQCMLAALESKIGVGRTISDAQATLPHELEPRPVANSKLEPKQCCAEDDGGDTNPLSRCMTGSPTSKARSTIKSGERSFSEINQAALYHQHSDVSKALNKLVRAEETDPHEHGEHPTRSTVIHKVVFGQKQETLSVVIGPKRFGATFVNSHLFGIIVATMIFLNGILILLQTDYTARNPSAETPDFYFAAETFFFFVFASELALRIWVFRCDFFIGEDWRWNCFDAMIVFAAFAEEVVKFIERGSTIAKKAMFLRVMRILKIGRITRVFRVVTVFRDLRIMVASIIATLMTLFWSIVCLVMIMVTFATYFLTVVSDHQATFGYDAELDSYFGSMHVMVLSLFQITTGGFDWRDMSTLLMAVSPLSVVILCIYVSMMEYAIMNILTGICCNTANKTAEDDFDITILEERSRQESATKKLTKFFRDQDQTGSGRITWDELNRHLANPQIRGYFKRLDLERWHLQSFFDLLETNDDSEPSIDIDHFIRGCTRLRCSVKNIDLIASSYEQHHARRKQFLVLKDKVDAVQTFLTCHTAGV